MLNVAPYAKRFIPPIVVDTLNQVRYRGKFEFVGDYRTWQEAVDNSSGYDSREILQRVKEAALKVKAGEAVYERDSVLFDQIVYSWPVLAGLLRAASCNENRLNVLDFGGSLGTSYYQNRKFFSGLQGLKWCVVEQPGFVATGKELFEDENLKFYYNINECAGNEKINVVLLSGVLQYFENPHRIIKDIVGLGVENILIDRTPFLSDSTRDVLKVQVAHPASYPHWFFERSSFLQEFVDGGYEVISEFEGMDKVRERNCQYLGFVLSKKRN